MSRIGAVSLDVGWTMLHPRRSIWEILADLGAEAGVRVAPEDAERVVHSLVTATREPAIASLEAGTRYTDSDEEFAAQFVALCSVVLSSMNIPGDGAAVTEEFLERFWRLDNWEVFPDVIDGIEFLRSAGARVGVLSNAATRLAEFLEELGLARHLDFIVISAVEGVKKPDRRIFERTLERAAVDASSLVHVGDMYVEDILGAERAGIRPLLMERGPAAMFPNHPESAGVPAGSCEIVRDLREVAKATALA